MTRPRKRIGPVMQAVLEFAEKHPGWHSLRGDCPAQQAVKALAKLKLIEIKRAGNAGRRFFRAIPAPTKN